ncbi:MAG: hypothetical protein A3A24_02570 [Candidatus Buchananbacteria bacterium RIFCSPLOWO2_01_FULL_46_12]|uniref:GIY-YIG domain-containing protein n=1 Tax=Candidatus Buchananbacteria bacterium RIFCSPLOWO2_01_FULL_46_12 TaxID=1797546 RepID=A0A1G1YN94_9BACT|nr:MAG: hypothetical protein A3A24_02570 [Candidatus Buchananbacteria bacterium RIFCSPLOWO2_01_FULL_46_12]
MFYLYLLKSKKRNWFYIGSTRDLKKRLIEHNSKKVKSTQFYSPFDLVYYEAYQEYRLARKREIELKAKGQQKEIILKRLGYL